jgi:hypothetical protein
MKHSKIWSEHAYKIHLESCSSKEEHERDAADVFMHELNALYNKSLRLDSKPDGVEHTLKAPDFLYVDSDSDVRVAIEVKQPFRNEYKC